MKLEVGDRLTIVGTGLTVIVSTVGAIFGFYALQHSDIKEMRREHREDVQRMDARWAALFEKFHDMDKIVAKYERKQEKING